MAPEYDDSYATCNRTWAHFRVFGDAVDPDYVTELLALTPRNAWHKGDPQPRPYLPPVARTGMWSISTKGVLDSRDLRRHLDHIADQLDGKRDALQALRDRGWKLDVMCFWEAANSGGPTLSPHQMCRFANLGLDVWIDFYPSPDSPDDED